MELMEVLAKALDKVLPETESVLVAVNARVHREGEDASDWEVLEGVTFTELAALAHHAGVTDDTRAAMLGRIARGRNEVAHFRALSYGDTKQISADAAGVLRSVMREGS